MLSYCGDSPVQIDKVLYRLLHLILTTPLQSIHSLISQVLTRTEQQKDPDDPSPQARQPPRGKAPLPLEPSYRVIRDLTHSCWEGSVLSSLREERGTWLQFGCSRSPF